MMKSIPISQEQLAALCRRHHVQRLALFGSALREDFRPESDVDVLVTFEPDAEIGFLALSRLRRELEAIFNRPVDLAPQEGLKSRIRESVLASAEPIYAR
ncbi:MAG: nucleotidyltransferase [Chloroflexi bacterium]|nr:nucleotidyltransferase [Chloroflexota bacterium]